MFPVAIIAELVIEKGATFDPILEFMTGDPPEILPLTGCEAQLLIKPSFETEDAETILEDFNTTDMVPTLEIDEAGGRILFHVLAEDTQEMEWGPSVYALYIDFPDEITRCVMRGKARIERGTR